MGKQIVMIPLIRLQRQTIAIFGHMQTGQSLKVQISEPPGVFLINGNNRGYGCTDNGTIRTIRANPHRAWSMPTLERFSLGHLIQADMSTKSRQRL